MSLGKERGKRQNVQKETSPCLGASNLARFEARGAAGGGALGRGEDLEVLNCIRRYGQRGGAWRLGRCRRGEQRHAHRQEPRVTLESMLVMFASVCSSQLVDAMSMCVCVCMRTRVRLCVCVCPQLCFKAFYFSLAGHPVSLVQRNGSYRLSIRRRVAYP